MEKVSLEFLFSFIVRKKKKNEGNIKKIKVWLALSNIYSYLEATLWKHRYSSSSGGAEKKQRNKQKSIRSKVPLLNLRRGISNRWNLAMWWGGYCQHPMTTVTRSQVWVRGQMPSGSRQIAKTLVMVAEVV